MTVQLATSLTEREQIYRMRYTTYIDELGHAHPAADPTGQTIRSPDDDGADVRHLYAVDEDGALIGALRLRLWRPGELPPAARASFHLDVFPEVDRYSVGEISNLVVSPAARSHEAGRRLRGAALVRGVREIGMQIVLCRCPLDRVPFWMRYGVRPYCDRLTPFSNGLLMPLAGLLADVEYNEACLSAQFPMFRDWVARGVIDVGDLPALRRAVERQQSVWVGRSHREGLLAEHGDRLAQLLSPEQLGRCARLAYAVRIEPGHRIMRVGSVEREPYFVIEGRFEVRSASGETRIVGPGNVLDAAAVAGQARRSTDAVALTPARVIVLGIAAPK